MRLGIPLRFWYVHPGRFIYSLNNVYVEGSSIILLKEG